MLKGKTDELELLIEEWLSVYEAISRVADGVGGGKTRPPIRPLLGARGSVLGFHEAQFDFRHKEHG